MMVICIKQHLRTLQTQFMKKLSITEAEYKKSVAYKKSSSLGAYHAVCRTQKKQSPLI